MVEQNRVQWVYSSRNNQELAERYDQSARDYDSDLEQVFAWNAPRRSAEIFARHVPKEARILDAGAGTGLVGLALSQLGYSQLTAMDLSAGMLDEARKQEVYQEYLQMVMGEPLDIPSGAFDAVISVGALTLGHAPASSLDELVRVTTPGSFASKVAEACHPESFGRAQDKFREGSGVVGPGLLRGAQPQIPRRSAPRNDRFEARLLRGVTWYLA